MKARRPEGVMAEVKREAARTRRRRERALLRRVETADDVVLPERNVEVSDEWNAW